MKIENLSFYCVNCSNTYTSETIELIKIKSGGKQKTYFECPDCSESDFQIYNSRYD